MAHQAPLKYVFYIAASPDKVWDGFLSRESNPLEDAPRDRKDIQATLRRGWRGRAGKCGAAATDATR